MLSSFLVAGAGGLDSVLAEKALLFNAKVVHGTFSQRAQTPAKAQTENFLPFTSASASLICVRSLFMKAEKFYTLFDKIFIVFDAKYFSQLYPVSADCALPGGAAVSGMADDMLFPYIFLAQEALAAAKKWANVRIFFVYRDAPHNEMNHLLKGFCAHFCAFAKSIEKENDAAIFLQCTFSQNDEECIDSIFENARIVRHSVLERAGRRIPFFKTGEFKKK